MDVLSFQKRKSCVCHLFNYFVLSQDFLPRLRSNFTLETLKLNRENKEVKIVLGNFLVKTTTAGGREKENVHTLHGIGF